jgi:hypothetical protein
MTPFPLYGIGLRLYGKYIDNDPPPVVKSMLLVLHEPIQANIQAYI